jgi:hypothetical protein
MRLLRNDKDDPKSVRTLALMFKCSHMVVMYHTDDEFRKKVQERVKRNSRERYKTVDKQKHVEKARDSREWLRGLKRKYVPVDDRNPFEYELQRRKVS